MNRKSFDREQERSHAQNDKLNGVHNVSTYQAWLAKGRTAMYRVLADGTVEFIRN